ncbi:KRAB-A domain-containing protein 2-like [Rhizophagus irregularis DAOM 181602=DAOM 197198]|nr:KRAB-A domain-containing protein 2-like [Rhizophagus irregularis DAOM 181602=DAOM 197198]
METEEFSFISKDTFNKIIDKCIQNSKSKTSEKQFINRHLYDEIKTVLLDHVSTLRDADFHYWCRKNFILLNTGGDSVVCKNNNKRTKTALDKEGKSADFLPILVLEEMYKTICLEHVQNVHCGQKNLYRKLRSKWYGVKKKIIEEFVNHCEICVPRRTMSKSTLAARPIVAKRFLSRVQMDLVDLRQYSDNDFKYILHVRDHFSRYSWAKPLTSKEPAAIAGILYEIFCQFGPPIILQSNNGKEFTAQIIKNLVDLWPGLKLVNGRPRHPQSQGLIERANSILEKKIGMWMEQNNSINWTLCLNYVIFTMNNTICRATNKTPYEIVFEQEDTSLDFEEENDENEDNNSNSIHDKHQSKSRNTKSLNKNSKNKGKQKQVTFAVNNNQNKESDYNHYNNDLNKDSDNFNKDSDDLNKDTDDSNEDSDDFNEDANNFNENSDDSNKDSDDFNEDHANNLNEDSDDFDENSEDFNDLRSTVRSI